MKKVLAFDIGGTNTRLVLFNEKHKIEKELVTPTPYGDEDKFINNCIEMIEQFPLENVVCIGAGVPGLVDDEKGIIISLVNVNIFNVKFREKLENKFNIPVHLINDASAGCIGEANLGAGKNFSRVFFVTISTGIGGSLCVDKKLANYVTEVGHTYFNYKNSIQEYEIASGKNITKLAKLNGLNYENMADFFKDVKAKNEKALLLYKEWLSIINGFIKLMNDSYLPDIFVFTGGVLKSKEIFWKDLQNSHPDILINECKFGERAGLIGTGVYAFDSIKE